MDEPLRFFFKTRSRSSVHFQYFHMMGLSERVSHERLAGISGAHYDREMVLVGERKPSGKLLSRPLVCRSLVQAKCVRS